MKTKKPKTTYRGICSRCRHNTILKNLLCRRCRDLDFVDPSDYKPIEVKQRLQGRESPWRGTLRMGKRIPEHIKRATGWYSGAGETVKLLIKFGDNNHDR